MFHISDGEYRVGLRVHTAVGDIDTGVAEQVLEQQRADGAKGPFHRLLVGRTKNPGRQYVRPDHPLHLDQMMIFIDTAVIGGDRFRGEERHPGHPVPGELRHHRGGDARVGPFHVLAPVIAQRKRHHHVA